MNNYDCNQTFRTKSNFSIKLPIRSWYAIKQTKPTQNIVNQFSTLNTP